MKLRHGGLLMVLILMAATFSGCAGSGDDISKNALGQLPQLLLGSFGDVGSILGSLTDSASAENAVPQLQGVENELDDLILEYGNSSPDVKSAMSDVAIAQIPILQTAIDQAYAIPGVESVVKSTVNSLMSKFKGF